MVSWGKMGQAGHGEADNIFVSGVKAKELMILWASFLFLPFNGKIKTMISSPLAPQHTNKNVQ